MSQENKEFDWWVRGQIAHKMRTLSMVPTVITLLVAGVSVAGFAWLGNGGWFEAAMVALALLALGNAFVAQRLIRREVVEPIQGVSAAMAALAQGNREVEVPETGREDEIGDMARALEVVKRAARKFDKLRGERDHEHSQQSAVLHELADKFEKTVGDVVGGVASASSQLQLTASSMASAAEQASLQTSEVSTNLGEASAGVTAAAAASDEFAMSIGEISRQASTSAELAP